MTNPIIVEPRDLIFIMGLMGLLTMGFTGVAPLPNFEFQTIVNHLGAFILSFVFSGMIIYWIVSVFREKEPQLESKSKEKI